MNNSMSAIGKKKVTINLVANIISFGLQLFVSFFLTPILINSLGKEVYSFYPIANNIVTYITIVTTALNTMASRFITVSIVEKSQDNAQKYYSSIFTVNIILAMIMAIPSVIFVVFLERILNVPINSIAAIKILFALVFVSALINIVSSIFGIATFAKNRLDLRSLREIVTSFVKALLYILFFYILNSSIIYIGITIVVIAIINLVFQYYFTKTLIPELQISFKFSSLECVKELLSSSLWNILSSIGGVLLSGLSLILSNILFGESSSGTYSIVQTVPNMLNSLISMLYGVFFPVLTYKYALGDKDVLKKEIIKDQSIVGTFCCAVIFVFSALSKEFFLLWVPGEDSRELFILSLCVIAQYLFLSCFYCMFHLSIAMNKVKIPAIFEIFLGLANLLISFIGCRFFGWTLISLPIVSSICVIIWIGLIYPIYISKRINVVFYEFYIPFVKNIVSGAIVFILIYKLKTFFELNSWFQFIMFGGISGFVALVVMYLVSFGPKVIFKSLISIIKIRK